MHTSSRSFLRTFLNYTTSSNSNLALAVSVPLFFVPAVASSVANGTPRSIQRRQSGLPYGCRRGITTTLGRWTLPPAPGDAARPAVEDQRKHGGHSMRVEPVEDAAGVPEKQAEDKLFQSINPNIPLKTSGWESVREGRRIHDIGKLPSRSTNAYSIDEFHLPLESNRHIPYWWVIGLEQSLPSGLRSPVRSSEDAFHHSRRPLTKEQLVQYLETARTEYNVDILEYLGCKQRRWQAVVWIVRHLLDGFHTGVRNTRFGNATPLASPLQFGRPQPDENTAKRQELRFDTLGQIWASLGSMIICASTQHPKENRKETMSYVLQIMAYLHHTDCVPDSAYNYVDSTQSAVIKRPPTLQYLSSRILTSLSDAAWRAHEQHVAAEAASVGAQYTYLGHEVPGARYKLKVRELGPEIWLELVLWCCVEAGFIREGAWIIAKLMLAGGAQEGYNYGRTSWNSVDWNTMQSPNVAREGHKSAVIDWDRIKRRPGYIFSMTEGYSAGPPVVEMGDRTISREVVAFLVEGLVDLLCVVQAFGNANSLRRYLAQIRMLKVFLEGNHGVSLISWNQVVLRIADCAGHGLGINPWILEEITELAAWPEKTIEKADISASFDASDCVHDGSLMIELWQRMVEGFARTDHIWGSLRAWAKLQSSADLQKWLSIKEFLGSEVQPIPEPKDKCSKPNLPVAQKRLKTCSPSIPVIAAFLDVATNNRFFEVGRWLLYTDDIDGPLIPEELYLDNKLVPALLNFASATGDTELRSKVMEGMSSLPMFKMKRNRLSSILGCEIDFANWDSVETILQFIARKQQHAWTASELTKLVVVVLKLESKISRMAINAEQSTELTSLGRAKTILSKLLRGVYGVARVPRIYDTEVSSAEDFMNSLRQAALSALPHNIHDELGISNKSKDMETRQFAHIPTNAFNTLLRGLVETRGSKPAYSMWQKWCVTPDDIFGDIDSQLGPSRFPTLEVIDESMMFERSRTGQGTPAELGLLWQSEGVRATHLFSQHRKEKVVASLGTLRILVQGALNERMVAGDGAVAKPSQSPSVTASPSLRCNNETKAQGEHYSEFFERSTTDELDDLIRWGDNMFRFFGLSEAEIAQEHGLTKQTIFSK